MRAHALLTRLAAMAAVGATLLAGCGGSSPGSGSAADGGASASDNDRTRSQGTAPGTTASGSTTPESTKSGSTKSGSTKPSSTKAAAAWPPADACTVVTDTVVATALGESLNSAPAARDGAYGPSCEYYSDVASPIAVIQAFPVADLKTYTESLRGRDAVVQVTGIGDSAFLSVGTPGVADSSIYVFAGTTAFSVQVSVYGGNGTWTTQRATDAAKAIARAVID